MSKCNCRFNWLEISQKHHDEANAYVNKKYPKSVDKNGKVTGHTEFTGKLYLCTLAKDVNGNPVMKPRKGLPINELLYVKTSFLLDLAKKGELTAICNNCKTPKLLKWVDAKRKADSS